MPTDPKLLLHLSFKFGERKRKKNKDVANKKRCKPKDQKSDEKPNDRGGKSMGTSKAVRSKTNAHSKPSSTAHQKIESQPPSEVLRTPMKTGPPDADATRLSSPSPQTQGPLIDVLDLFRLHTKQMEERGLAIPLDPALEHLTAENLFSEPAIEDGDHLPKINPGIVIHRLTCDSTTADTDITYLQNCCAASVTSYYQQVLQPGF
ncbi:hypothetical protein PGT21_025987 [Puccinia graminis f. sp. tritici]|uniref:Uncharacterized protein n=1 Tax=Puccinia graminis f. sp. tritici TaxID=56615 RepID=A0A5B0PIZ7_PUCGR|nr:hypothetical protein PGT21_025987 [Puccinia graminis f. sp. tritici]